VLEANDIFFSSYIVRETLQQKQMKSVSLGEGYNDTLIENDFCVCVCEE